MDSVVENLTLRDKARGAFWGAAAGDALGWPQEMPGRRVRQTAEQEPASMGSFETWQRKSGGRFMPHQETIHAGEYSDDTQLLMCTARAILKGRDWLKHFAHVELPTWSAYERGGGGATKRAVDLLMSGKLPWSEEVDLDWSSQYFNAGGNGVAMRILPHALKGAHQSNFLFTARAIFLNGICTHGHPRALLGGLVYGYVAWQAFRHSGTLPYGHLLEIAIENISTWTALPESSGVVAEWKIRADQVLDGRFDNLWTETVHEVHRLLVTALAGIKAGALSIDGQILSDIGCFDRRVNGAGTISAIASIYLASKFAPDPQHGLVEAAFAKGADTDTLASMVGGLLGTVSGLDWLQSYRNSLQDESYLEKLAQQICATSDDGSWDEDLRRTTLRPRTAVDRFTHDLSAASQGEFVTLPDDREARVQNRRPVMVSSNSLRGEIWTLKTADGQTVHVKKLSRAARNVEEELINQNTSPPKRVSQRKKGRFTSKVQAIKLTVKHLEKARSFYGEVLGLKVKRESKNVVNFGGTLALVPINYMNEVGPNTDSVTPTRSIICLETSNLALCHLRVKECIDARATAITEMFGRRFFRCFDPDQNVIEIFDRASKTTASRSAQ